MNKIIFWVGHNFSNGDRGAVANWTTEADFVNELVNKLVKTRVDWFQFIKCPNFKGIKERNQFVNANAPDMYMEFHLDSFVSDGKSNPTGCTTFFVDKNTWAEWEAKQFQMEYTRVTWMKGRGVKSDATSRFGRLWAIRDNKYFSLLVELGFITNKEDLKIIQEKWIDWIIAGIKIMFKK